MAEQLLSGQGGSLYIPGWIGRLKWLRMLPWGVAHKIRVGATLDLKKSKREDRPNPPMP